MPEPIRSPLVPAWGLWCLRRKSETFVWLQPKSLALAAREKHKPIICLLGCCGF